MQVLQNFNEEEKDWIRKEFILSEVQQEFVYLELILSIFEICYTLARNEEYIGIIKDQDDSIELDSNQKNLAKKLRLWINILKNYKNLRQSLKFYNFSLYVQEFFNQVDNEIDYWGDTDNSFNNMAFGQDKLADTLFLEKTHQLQRNLIQLFNAKTKNEAEKNFSEQLKAVKRNLNKNYSKFLNNIDDLLSTYGEVVVVRFELCYMPRMKKSIFSIDDIKQHRKKFFSMIGKTYIREFQYYGFVWQLKFNQLDRLKFKVTYS